MGLCCCTQPFSSCGELGLLSSCSVRSSHCRGFSCSGAWALGVWAELPHSLWDFTRLGIKPVFPALQGGFLTTQTPLSILFLSNLSSPMALNIAYGRKWRGTKKPLEESESGKWKSWLKAQHSENKDHGIWSHRFMGNRWGNSGNSIRLFGGGSQITADGGCSHEIKRHLLLGRKVMTNLDSIFKSRDITLPTKVRLVKAVVFPVVMYGCESWTVKKAEHQRIDAFELWCWGRFLRVPWTARRTNQSILKEISPGCSLEGMMLKLKL